MSRGTQTVDAELEKIQHASFGYFLHETNPVNGLVIDKTAADIWIDFRGIQDAFMRSKGIDYFENSRRATYVHQQYAIDNPLKFAGYGRHYWGLTASDGPGPDTIKVNGIERQFFDYVGRGVPYGPDDGTIAPWAVVASLPFAPEIVLPTMGHLIHQVKLTESNPYGFKATFNQTRPEKSGNPLGWVSGWHFGLNKSVCGVIEHHHVGGDAWPGAGSLSLTWISRRRFGPDRPLALT